jgi:hypothetical protein
LLQPSDRLPWAANRPWGEGVATIDTLGGPQRVTVVNEAGLYEAMRQSQMRWISKAAAKEKQREHGGTAPGRKKDTSANSAQVKRAPQTRDIVAKATGMDARTLAKAEAVVAAKLATLPIGSSTDPIPSGRAEGHKAVRPWRERKPDRQRARL